MPRYTSYPTAPHFTGDVDAAVYGDWLSTLAVDTPVSLYLHIPFCKEMCWYCGCFTKIVNRYAPIEKYIDTLLAETDLVAERIAGRVKAHAIHWGGGSPTILTPDDWRRTMARLHRNFDIADDAEIAVEMDPRTTTKDYVAALAACGVNRVSIGVQDFDPAVQQAINRIQPFEMTKRVIIWLRDAGIDAINLDLMYGLPHQNTARVAQMTEQALSLEPSRIALFGYAHVPWMKSHQRLIDEAALPDTEARWHQANVAAGLLTAAGYVRIGLDHFAHPSDAMAKAISTGSLKRNFQGYTTDTASVLLGFGASAIGTLPQGYVQNAASIKGHREKIEAGALPIARGFMATAEDKLRRAIIEHIMCDMDVDIGSVCRSHGLPENWLDDEIAALEKLHADGLVEIQGRCINVTDIGRPLVRTVAAAFDAYLATGTAKHSSAV